MSEDTSTAGALARLRAAADRAGAGWLPGGWDRVSGPGPDRYEMREIQVLGPGLGRFEQPLALEPGGQVVIECDLDIPAQVAGVDTAGDPLLLTVWSLFPIRLLHVSADGGTRSLLAEEVPPAASGPVLVEVVPSIGAAGNGRLRADVRTFDTQVYKQWNWFGFTTPGLQARFEAVDVAWAQLFLADAVAATAEERKAVDAATQLVPDDLLGLSAADLAAALDEVQAALSPVARKVEDLDVHLVGHSHIDMNWLWTWPDTVEVIKRDFRSILALMDEFPEMRFTHSQPATYAVVRDEEPDLFEKVKAHIASGRWEAATMQWVEGDTNMAGSEATARQALEAVWFAREELGTEPHVFLAPDTFGHAGNLPQVTASAGTRVYYHHRCNPGHPSATVWPAYWWEGQDGTRVLAVSTHSYNGHISAGAIARASVELGTRHGLGSSLCFYGVGDHGGGPTRESLEALRRLQQRPGLPRARCSTVGAYADSVTASGVQLPVHRGESGTTFEGCYTTHADSKRYNREGENLLQTADTLSALAGVDARDELVGAWRTVLFNQFHDIFDGSAIADVYRDQAADHERVTAAANGAIDAALAVLHDGLPDGHLAVTNPLAWPRREPVVAASARDDLTAAVADDGTVLPLQRVEGGVLFVAEVAGFATRTYRLVSDVAPDLEPLAVTTHEAGDRAWIDVQTPLLDARVRTASGIITSLVDRRTGRQLVPRGLVDFRPELAIGVLQVQDERPHDMSSWDIREVEAERALLAGATTRIVEEGPLRVVLEVQHEVRSSSIKERITFHRDLPRIDIDLDIDWQEPGGPEHGVPDLKLSSNVHTSRPEAWFETPFGAVERAADGMEVPALRWAAVQGDSGGIAVVNTDKHGYDVLGTRLRLTLVRTAYDPDPASDIGHHRTSLSIVPLVAGWQPERLVQTAAGRNQPLLVREVRAGRTSTDSLLGRWQPEVADGPVVVASAKVARRGRGRILRLYESTGTTATTEIRGVPPGTEVWEVSVVEDRVSTVPVDGDRLHLGFRPWQVRTLLFEAP